MKICAAVTKTVFLIVFVAGLGGAGYYFFFRKTNKNEKTNEIEKTDDNTNERTNTNENDNELMQMKPGDGCGGEGVTYTPKIGTNKYTLIFLHGYNDTIKSGLLPTVLSEDVDIAKDWKIIMPYASRGDDEKRRWAALSDADFVFHPEASLEDTDGYRTTSIRIAAIIACEMSKHKTESSHIVLGGFNQGGNAASVTGLEIEKPLLGLFGISSWVPLLFKPKVLSLSVDAPTLNILFLHGKLDQVLTSDVWNLILNRVSSRTHMGENKIPRGNIETKEFDGVGHELVREEIDYVVEYLQRRVAALLSTESLTDAGEEEGDGNAP